MLADLQQLMDPSRNMSRYRQHLAQLAQEPPLIPIYPILRKDLTFAHEANPTFCGPRLVNFEKLRMIAQIIRNIQRFSSVHYDPSELYIGNNGGSSGGGTAEVVSFFFFAKLTDILIYSFGFVLRLLVDLKYGIP